LSILIPYHNDNKKSENKCQDEKHWRRNKQTIGTIQYSVSGIRTRSTGKKELSFPAEDIIKDRQVKEIKRRRIYCR